MKMRLYTPISLLLFAGLGAAGCAESFEDAPETHQSSHELVLLSAQDEAPGAQAMNLVYSQARGWHMSFTANLQETNLPGTENYTVREQPLDFSFDEDDEQPGQGNTPAPSRFSTSLAGQTRFSASVPGAYGFNSAVPGSSSFSSSLPTSYSFSTGLSTGGSCSLTGLCDFVETLCSLAPGAEGCGGAEIAQCRSQMSRAQADIPAEARPFVCALGNYFTCAASALRSGGNAEATMQACTQNNAGAGLLFFLLFAAAMGA